MVDGIRKHRHVTPSAPRPPRYSVFVRTLAALASTLAVFVIGSALFVGVKAYTAQRAMTLSLSDTSPVTTPEPVTKSPDTPHTQTPSDTVENFRAPENSELRGDRAPIAHRPDTTDDIFSLRGAQRGIITILLLGADTRKDGRSQRTDTIMLAQIHTVRGKIALLSLPRDLYVRYRTNDGVLRQSKINALYDAGLRDAVGATYIVRTVEHITGAEIDYVLAADFDAFISVVDALGGINVTVERPIHDTRYPTPDYGYETFTLPAGLHHMDGATALKYVRSRHGDPEGDFGRAKRQQAVLRAIKNKAFSLGTLTNARTLGALLDALGAHVKTTLSIREMLLLAQLLQRSDTQNIITHVVDAWRTDSLLRAVHIGNAFALIPRSGRDNYTEIRALTAMLFDLPSRQRVHEAVRREQPRISIYHTRGQQDTATRVRTIIQEALGVPESAISLRRVSQQPSVHAQITVYDDSRFPFSITALRRALGAEHTVTSTPRDTDIIVHLGETAEEFFRPNTISQDVFNNAL